MIESILYAVLAILGLGFLVFIHELGHFIVARRQKMRVEAFSIGFGRPIYSWMKDGVKWQIGILPFGGFVKIAGMQKEGGVEPSMIPDGFYGKSPWQRIKVALAGPIVNIVFSLLVFAGLWVFGGRAKNFQEFTSRIGWVDPKSALYEKGVRSGDRIQSYGGREFHGFKDLLMSSIMKSDETEVVGEKINYQTGEREPFHYVLTNYQDPRSSKEKLSTIGIMSPAQYLIYDPDASTKHPSLKAKDRLLWADGEILFSGKQLSHLINDSTAFLTVEREGRIFQTKVPRVHLSDLSLSPNETAEIDDWQHEARLKGDFGDLYYIPYNLSSTNQVEGRLSFIDTEDSEKAFAGCERCAHFNPLQEGDQILAVDGIQVQNPYNLLKLLQTRRVLMIVDRNPESIKSTLWTHADEEFEGYNKKDLSEVVSSIGTENGAKQKGTIVLLSPIEPKTMDELSLSPKEKAAIEERYLAGKQAIEKVRDPVTKQELLKEFEKAKEQLVLGIPSLKDRSVQYNPGPFTQFKQICQEAWHTLSNLFTGGLNPKYLSGPVGIVHVVHQSWHLGIKEALFWMAAVSLNLGIVNLLPIPVLDGGHIMFSLYEAITKKRLSSKAMERMIFPFIVCLIGLFIYITFQDITRLFSKFF